MLKVLLKLFPRRFQERFGDEWMEVSEALLERAQTQGSGKTAAAWLSLCSDVGTQAPAAHARQAWRAIVGTPPVLAGAGVLGGTWLLARHWGGRPALAMGRGLIKYAWALVAGGVVAFALHGWLEQRAWAVSTALSEVGAAGSGVAHNPQALTIMVGVMVVALMLTAGWPRLMALAKKVTVKKMIGSLVVFLAGFYLVLTSIFLGQFRGLSTDAISDFVVYPEIVNSPTRMPSSANPEEWTAEQLEWFDSERPWRAYLRPEKKEQWCALKDIQLKTWHKTIMARDGGSPNISLLLWQSMRTQQYVYGCMDEATWLSGHDGAAFSVQEGHGLFQRTWEPLAPIHPLVDWMSAAHHIVWPRLVMDPQKYCLASAQVMAAPDHVVNHNELVAVCSPFETQSEKGALGAKSWWRPQTAQAKQANLEVNPMTESQRQEIRRTLEAMRGRWQEGSEG